MALDPILKTKLFIPPCPEGNLSRTRLLNLVSWGLQRKVTMITAPAGFGKTSLVLDWISKSDQPVAWYSIDAYDDNFISFFSYVVAAIRTILPQVGDLLVRLPNQKQQLEHNKLLIPIINEIADSGEEIILVMDDFHEINSQEVLLPLCYLIEHCPENLHILFISRSVPKIPCAKLAVQSDLAHITEDDLRFNGEECQQFVRQYMGPEFSENGIRAVCQKTEGWAALLQLAVTYLHGKENKEEQIRSFSGVTTSVSDYLLDEIFADVDEDTFQFSIETSLFDRFSADLCNYVFQRVDSADQLAKLEKLHLFLRPLDDQREWFRNHNMIADYLQKQWEEKSSRLIKEKHIRAVEWFRQNHLMPEAVNHAQLAGDMPLLIETIKSVADEQWASGQYHVVAGWLDRLPVTDLKKDIELCFLFSWTNYLLGKNAAVDLGLEWAELNLNTIQQEEIPPRFIGMRDSVRAAVFNRNNQHSRSIELARNAKELLPKDYDYWQIATSITLGITYQALGNFRAAKDVLKETLPESKQVNFPLATMTAYSILAETAILQGKLSEALSIAQDGIAYVSQKSLGRFPVMGELYYRMAHAHYFLNQLDHVWELFQKINQFGSGGLLYYRQVELYVLQIKLAIDTGDFSEAEKLIGALANFVEGLENVSYKNKTYALRALLALGLNQIERAVLLIDQFADSLKNTPVAMSGIEIGATLETRIASRDFVPALKLIDDVLPVAIENEYKPILIMVLMNQAEIYFHQSKMKKMILALDQAILYAEEENIIRYFVIKGNNSLKMLKIYQREQGKNTAFVRKLIQQIQAETKKTVVPGKLTKREIEVLGLIADGHTNREVGEILVISVETVNNHTRNIYTKLGVNSRVQAVSRAKETSLLE